MGFAASVCNQSGDRYSWVSIAASACAVCTHCARSATSWPLSVCAVWESQRVPEEWLLSHVTLICKKGPTRSALNYRPISVSCRMYLLISRLLLNALKEALEKSLSPTQAGSRKGYTTSSHALSLWSELVQREKSYDCIFYENRPKGTHLCHYWDGVSSVLCPKRIVTGCT